MNDNNGDGSSIGAGKFYGNTHRRHWKDDEQETGGGVDQEGATKREIK